MWRRWPHSSVCHGRSHGWVSWYFACHVQGSKQNLLSCLRYFQVTYFLKFCLFTSGWTGSLLLQQVGAASCSVGASRCGGSSCCGAQAPRRGLNSQGTWASLPHCFPRRKTLSRSLPTQPPAEFPPACGIFPDRGWNLSPLHWESAS